MTPSHLSITVLACALLALTEGSPLKQYRCHCPATMQKEISDNRIVKLDIFQPGPHCKDMEIIATVKFRKEITLCLNPKEEWVQKILEKRNLASQFASDMMAEEEMRKNKKL